MSSEAWYAQVLDMLMFWVFSVVCFCFYFMGFGWGCSSVGRAWDQHAADAGSIPWCSKGFFSQSQLSVQTLLRVSIYPPCATACINICAHIKDLLVHVRVWWIMETLKHPACTVGWVAQLCCSWLSLEKQPEFPTGEIPFGQYICEKEKKKEKVMIFCVFFLSFSLDMYRVCTGAVWWSKMPVSWLLCISRMSRCGVSVVQCLAWPSSKSAKSMFSLYHRVRLVFFYVLNLTEIHFPC